MNGILLCEMDAAEIYKVLHPSMRIRSTNTPMIGTNISLPNQTYIVANAFIASRGKS